MNRRARTRTGADVLSNEIFSTHVFDGVAVIGGYNNTVKGNAITSSDTATVFLIGDSNAVSSNRIQETPVGIWDYSGIGNTYPTGGASTFLNVGVLTITGTPLARLSSTASGAARERIAVRP